MRRMGLNQGFVVFKCSQRVSGVEHRLSLFFLVLLPFFANKKCARDDELSFGKSGKTIPSMGSCSNQLFDLRETPLRNMNPCVLYPLSACSAAAAAALHAACWTPRF